MVVDDVQLPTQPINLDNHDVDVHQDNEEPLTLPVGHLTTTSNLFQLETMRKLVGDYPDNVFYQLESNRTINLLLSEAPSLEDLDRDSEVADALARKFFADVHSHLPILDERDYLDSPSSFGRSSPERRAGVALRLIMLASGKMILNKRNVEVNKDPHVDGIDYFTTAYNMLVQQWALSFEWDLELPAGLIMAAVYFYHLGWPLQGWKLVHMAATTLQMYYPRCV